jgi:peptide/nickel transport system permease protein
MATLTAEPTAARPARAARINRWDSPWLNAKLIVGLIMVLTVALSGVVGGMFWDLRLARVGTSPQDLPPVFIPGGTWEHPLGTENSGRDMLAVILTGAPRSFRIGLIAATIGLLIGVVLGCIAGFLGGWVDRVILIMSDAWITIPSLVVLIVISAFVRQISAETMAVLIALFAWPGPTRVIRAQVLTLRERGYIRMARLSGANTFDVIFREMMPNMLPYIAASYVGTVSGAILASAGLEALGLGPTRIPTLGMTIFYANQASAVIRGMWWWWGFPILILAIIFSGLFLIATGLDEVANPRLRGLQAKQ